MPKQAGAHLTMLPDGAGLAGDAGRVDEATYRKLLADRNYAPRRFIHLTTPTPGATIYYTTDGSDPRTSATRVPYDVTATGHIQELVGERSGAKGPQPYRLVTWKTVAVKNGVAVSPVRTFKWNLVRPWQSRLWRRCRRARQLRSCAGSDLPEGHPPVQRCRVGALDEPGSSRARSPPSSSMRCRHRGTAPTNWRARSTTRFGR